MKKSILISAIIFSLLVLPSVTLARGEVVVDPQSSQVQNQGQGQTENQGEDQQQSIAQEQESSQSGQDETDESKGRSETARQHMSMVAQAVEELLTTQGAKGGIGQQISEVARQQQQAQQDIGGQLDKLEARRGWMKTLFGPDYKAIKNLEQQMEQNQLRIRQLEQLQAKVTNEAEQTQIQEVIQALIEQNTALQEQIQAEEQAGSLLGWLFKLFIK